MSAAPLLSIGMIFKNEARCLERCLRSLQPLRDAIPCELVMADTGSDDGSRKIAEQYADEVFDFEWIDDFSAARNAVMDKCHGKWHLSIDCDEWLDADLSELLQFLKRPQKSDTAFVVMRNYHSAEMEAGENFSTFFALRLVRMSTGYRYHNAIHESLPYKEPTARLSHTILNHDGYFYIDAESQNRKLERNMKLLRKKLEQKPENLFTLIQCIESCNDNEDVQYARHAVDIVRGKRDCWEIYGGNAMRHAIRLACKHELPEYEEWLDFAEKNFSDSIFIKIDVNYSAFFAAHNAKNWEKAIHYGEAYRKGMHSLRNSDKSKKVTKELGTGTLLLGHEAAERSLLLGLADAYFQAERWEKSLEIFADLDGSKLIPEQVPIAAIILCQLHVNTLLSISPALTTFYNQIGSNDSDRKKREERLTAFQNVAASAFTQAHQEEERKQKNYHRPAFTAFACLADRCEAGRGAKLMLTDDPDEMRQILVAVEDWQALPIEALEHALAAGVPFPLPDKPLPMEALDGLAARLTHDENMARQLVLDLPDSQEYDSLQSLAWAQSLSLAALRSFDWTLGKSKKPASPFYCPEKKKDEAPDRRPECTPAIGLALIRRFAALETAALPALYAPQLLTEENAALLPPMHRWGFYCGKALAALDAGDPQGYLATLRRGLTACPGQKQMVQFLLDRFLEDARPKADPELLALADRVRAILAAYAPDDPTVAAIRQSPAYHQVAWLIETPSAAPAASALPADVIVAPLPQ